MLQRYRAFSLVEMMIVVAILAIFAVAAAPSFLDLIDRSRLRGATDEIASLVATARGESVKRSRDVTVVVGGSTTAWCVGANEAATPATAAAFAASAACDCTQAAECFVDGVRRVVSVGTHEGVGANAVGTTLVFDGKLGTVVGLASNTVTFSSPRGKYQASLVVSPLGQARLCTPIGQPVIPGYPTC